MNCATHIISLNTFANGIPDHFGTSESVDGNVWVLEVYTYIDWQEVCFDLLYFYFEDHQPLSLRSTSWRQDSLGCNMTNLMTSVIIHIIGAGHWVEVDWSFRFIWIIVLNVIYSVLVGSQMDVV